MTITLSSNRRTAHNVVKQALDTMETIDKYSEEGLNIIGIQESTGIEVGNAAKLIIKLWPEDNSTQIEFEAKKGNPLDLTTSTDEIEEEFKQAVEQVKLSSEDLEQATHRDEVEETGATTIKDAASSAIDAISEITDQTKQHSESTSTETTSNDSTSSIDQNEDTVTVNDYSKYSFIGKYIFFASILLIILLGSGLLFGTTGLLGTIGILTLLIIGVVLINTTNRFTDPIDLDSRAEELTYTLLSPKIAKYLILGSIMSIILISGTVYFYTAPLFRTAALLTVFIVGLVLLKILNGDRHDHDVVNVEKSIDYHPPESTDSTNKSADEPTTSTNITDNKTKKARDSVRNELRLGEKSFREAVAAYVNDSKTVANIRFRQARDQYQDALTRIERSDQDIFREQIEVSNKIGIDPPPEKIADIPVLSDESISALNKYGIELITDIGNGNPSMIVPDDIDKLNNNISTEYREFDMIVISWWYDEESQVFDSRKTVSIRCNQAERGFEET